MARPRSESGDSPHGGRYAIEVPEGWNGTLLLFSRGLPLGPQDRPWEPTDPLVAALLADGYAVAGAGGTIFWPLEQTFANQEALLDAFARVVGEPSSTIA